MGFFTRVFGGKPRVIKIIKNLVEEATLLVNNMESKEAFEKFLASSYIKYENQSINSYIIIFNIDDSKWELTCLVDNKPAIVIKPLQTTSNFEDEEFRVIYFVVKKNLPNHYGIPSSYANMLTPQEITAIETLKELGFINL